MTQVRKSGGLLKILLVNPSNILFWSGCALSINKVKKNKQLKQKGGGGWVVVK